MSKRIFLKINKDNIPQVKDRYPFIYLERGRLEVDDSSVKWINCDSNIVQIPCAIINSILLGPGTSITHEAVKVLASSNCCVQWVGEDSLLYYAIGQSPTATTNNFKKQMSLAADPIKCEKVVRNMFIKRFPKTKLQGKSIREMIGMEGIRVKKMYLEKAKEYNMLWSGRSYTPGEFELSDITNRYLTSANAALYGIVLSVIYSMGYSPHIGFIHSGSPLPFVYDVADLYKEYLCVDTAFYLTVESAGEYIKEKISSEFRQRIIDSDLLGKIGNDLNNILKV